MSEDDERTKAQLTDLFAKDKAMTERVLKIEIAVAGFGDMLKGINATNQRLEQCHKDSQIAIFGDEKLGVKGLIKETQEQSSKIGKHEAIIVKVGIGIVVTVALLKYLGYWDKLITI